MSMENEPKIMSIASRITRLNVEKAEIEEMIKEVYQEAKDSGYEPKILKRAVRIMGMDEGERKKMLAEDEVLNLYLRQLDLPL